MKRWDWSLDEDRTEWPRVLVRVCIEEDDEGDWVRYADAQSALDEKDEELEDARACEAALEAIIDGVMKHVDDGGHRDVPDAEQLAKELRESHDKWKARAEEAERLLETVTDHLAAYGDEFDRAPVTQARAFLSRVKEESDG